MVINSAASFFRAANGKKVIKYVEGALTIESWDDTVENCKQQLIAQNCPVDKIIINESGLQYPGGFIMKPKESAKAIGTMQIRSSDYGFKADNAESIVWGDKKGAKIVNGNLVKEYDNGRKIIFEIME